MIKTKRFLKLGDKIKIDGKICVCYSQLVDTKNEIYFYVWKKSKTKRFSTKKIKYVSKTKKEKRQF